MTTSGLTSAIHSLDLSKPENTRFQYGSSVFLLSIAAPMAGTCDDVAPAIILATFRSCLFPRWAHHPVADLFALLRFAAVTLDRTAAAQHHLRIVFLGGPRHLRGQMLERVSVGGPQLGGEVDVSAKLQHPVVVALEDGLALLRRQREAIEIFRLVRFERLAVFLLH